MADRSSPPHEAELLLIEDNPGDVRLIEEALLDGYLSNTLHIVTDGQEALDFIHRRGEYEDAPRPDIILLDLKLPKVSGEDVLHEIKHHPDLAHVPVIILAGIDEELVKSLDIDHDADEDGVLEKPVSADELFEVIGEFDGFRLSIVYNGDG